MLIIGMLCYLINIPIYVEIMMFLMNINAVAPHDEACFGEEREIS
jgi:hypothetical protein